MRRELGQLSLADGLVEGAGRNRQLERIAALVDGASFARARRGLRRPGRAAVVRAAGAAQLPATATVVPAVRPRLEEALSDRLSFRRFVGLATIFLS
jgi:IS5 family transposase